MFMPNDPTGADARRRERQAQAAAQLAAQSMVTGQTVAMIQAILATDAELQAQRRQAAAARALMLAAQARFNHQCALRGEGLSHEVRTKPGA